MTLAVIDDDETLLSALVALLSEAHYHVLTAKNGSEALTLLKTHTPHLLICDLGLPDINGLDLCKQIKERFPALPFLFLSGSDSELDMVLAFETGAQDYITKPFREREFLARIKGILARPQENTQSQSQALAPDQATVIEQDHLKIDSVTRRVSVDNQTKEFTKKEFDLLFLLASTPNQIFTRDMILARIWENNLEVKDRIVDIHISNIRDKIEPDRANPAYIQTVRGIGYRFVTDNLLFS
jgi:two-component system alkaline phosphatase synthesis response regulator PhoP